MLAFMTRTSTQNYTHSAEPKSIEGSRIGIALAQGTREQADGANSVSGRRARRVWLLGVFSHTPQIPVFEEMLERFVMTLQKRRGPADRACG